MKGSSKVDPGQIIDRFTSVLGNVRAVADNDLAAKLTGQNDAVVVLTPENEDELCAAMRIASEEQWTIAPIGGRTQLGVGNVPRRIDVALELTKLNKVTDYSPEDMVVSVQAGTPISELQEILGQAGQMLPVDPVCKDGATIGGIVATGASGPMRAHYGTFRDLAIGLRTIYPDGRLIKTGGKVVKNVAGYDMTKLFVASLGTLACLSEITFKVRPLPLYRSLAVVSGNEEACQQFALSVARSNLIPSKMEALSGSFRGLPNPQDGWSVAVDCDENQASGSYQLATLKGFASELGLSFASFEAKEVEQFWIDYRNTLVDADFVIRFTAQPKTLILAAEQLKKALQPYQSAPCFSLSVTAGIARLFFDGADAQTAEAIVNDCRRIGSELGGKVIIESGSVALRQKVNSFNVPRSDFPLQKGIKDTIDPLSILNPGRLFGGI